jgi:outer membrane protein TolC
MAQLMPRAAALALLLPLGCLWPAAAGAAAPPAQFPLDAAVRRTLAQSPAVQMREAEIDRREGVREQASGEFDWRTTASTLRFKDRTPSIDPLGRDTVTAGDTTTYSVGVTRKLRSGVILQPSTQVAMVDGNSPPSPALGSSQLSLQIVVPLLRGLGTDSTGAAEAAARGDVEVARLLYRHALAEQAFATVQAYWTARAAQAAIAVRRDEESRAQRLHDGIKVLVDTRIFAPNLLLQSEANLRQKSIGTQSAELTALEAIFTLGRIMGLPPAEMARAAAPDEPLPGEIATPAAVQDAALRGRWIERALRQRADFQAVRQSEVPLRVLARQAEKDLKPRLDLSVRGGYEGLNRGHSLLEPLSQRLTGANGEVGVVLDWPGANTYQRGLLRSRRAAQRQAELTTAQSQSDIAAEVCTALAEVRLRAETMANARATADIARKAVDQEQRRLQTGEATVLDVINLENLLSSARLSEIDAQAGYAIAVARLRHAVGEIFLADQADRSFPLADLTQLPADEK